MESLPKDKILQYNDNTLEEVRKCFNLDRAGAMKASVDMLEEWVKKQDHFTKKNFDRRYLEVTIILCKGSLERAKERLDRACTMRTLMPHVFDVYDLRDLYIT
ncbi:hypothetical protein NE865_08685 [Phthorimaea operculella]|nr:hypothetical protein NE865_08685 [Phthorimaea operculella]